jgi:CO/xanthine dehydrogenase Mo-binding subunit
LESKNENPKAIITDFPQALPRIDLKDKVTGQAQYIEDLPDLPLTAYAATLLSPYSHAKF